jgi:hypothetical protein
LFTVKFHSNSNIVTDNDQWVHCIWC